MDSPNRPTGNPNALCTSPTHVPQSGRLPLHALEDLQCKFLQMSAEHAQKAGLTAGFEKEHRLEQAVPP